MAAVARELLPRQRKTPRVYNGAGKRRLRPLHLIAVDRGVRTDAHRRAVAAVAASGRRRPYTIGRAADVEEAWKWHPSQHAYASGQHCPQRLVRQCVTRSVPPTLWPAGGASQANPSQQAPPARARPGWPAPSAQ